MTKTVAVLCAALLALTACGGGDDETARENIKASLLDRGEDLAGTEITDEQAHRERSSRPERSPERMWLESLAARRNCGQWINRSSPSSWMPDQSVNRYLTSVQSAGKPSFQEIFLPSE